VIVPLLAVEGTADISQQLFVSAKVPDWTAAEITLFAVREGETFVTVAEE
jgi:hypothetical protein